jgi:type IX secretion system PorP/SprF family membrane protein
MRRVLIVLLIFIPYCLAGQLGPVTNQYILNPLTLNPACAGDRGALNMAAFYRKQWVGVAGAPVTMTLAADAPFADSRLGLGLLISNDRTGVMRETRIRTAYAYRIRMNSGVLSFGLGAGVIATNTAWSDLVVTDPEDSHYLVDSRVFAVPDFSFGTFYLGSKFFAGVSVPRLIGYDFNFEKNKYSMSLDFGKYSYLLNSGYLVDFSSKTGLLLSTLLTYIPGNGLLYDVNAHLNFNERMWTGISYRNDRSLAALLQVSVSNQLKMAYTYDFDFGRLGRYSAGSHEVMVRYELKYRVDAVSPLIF